ncbi:LPXTG cell wall anchor domain-containing protein (plasmid) [Lactococcus garvieae]|uniref:LPXTG cell wall anchor domain-containing protein n=1 Tax=Lactococcus garvieae TaxID=1363 RepID=UPI0030D17C24
MMKKIFLLGLCALSFLFWVPQVALAEGSQSWVTGVLTEESTPSSSETEESSGESGNVPQESVTTSEQTQVTESQSGDRFLPSTGEDSDKLLLGLGLALLALGGAWLLGKKVVKRHD